jgi:serine/threonine protein phosphatase PrpC
LAGRSLVLVADGLGHGPEARVAATAACDAFAAARAEAPLEILERIHLALKPTRGAAVAVAEIDRGGGVLRFAGLGNIAATVVSDGKTRSLVSLHGTAGHDARRLRDFASPWMPGDVLVMCSDGIATRWTLDAYPGLLERHPMLLAAALYRDFQRGRDDATVVVVRNAP